MVDMCQKKIMMTKYGKAAGNEVKKDMHVFKRLQNKL